MIDKELHKSLGELFENNLIRDDGEPSILCDIYDKLTEGNEIGENCIGENFNQLIQCIKSDFFENYQPTESTSIEFYFATYNYWLYLIVERFEFIFEVINPDGKSKLIPPTSAEVTSVLIQCTEWAIIRSPLCCVSTTRNQEA